MEKIDKLKKNFKENNIEGYIVPKNDEFFGEYIAENKDRLKYISNFSGSYGFALILNNKNYLFIDGRYTLQAKIQSGNNFGVGIIDHNHDFQNVQPAGIGFDSSYIGDMSTAAQRSRWTLTLTYTIAGWSAGDMNGVANGDMGEVNGVVIADINEINGV